MYGDVSRKQAQDLLTKAEGNGVDTVELIRRLMLESDLAGWYHQRCAGDGAGRIKRINLVWGGFEFETWDGDRYEYSHERSGSRWRTNQGWISRTRLETALGVWPGYLDAIEDLYSQVQRFNDGLERAAKEARDRDLEWYLQRCEQERARWAVCRHPELARWREQNPTPTQDVPLALRSVRHIKHIDTAQACHVYFLLREGEVVYVGQTAAPWPSRILTHLKNPGKTFDDVWCLEVDYPSLNDVERHFIREFDPVYNRRRTACRESTGTEAVVDDDCRSAPETSAGEPFSRFE